MATHSRISAWKFPWTGQRSLEGYSPWGHKESDTTEQLSTHFASIWGGFPGGSDGKQSTAMQETSLRSLGWQDPLEKEMATQSSILACRSLVGHSPWGHKESNTTND